VNVLKSTFTHDEITLSHCKIIAVDQFGLCIIFMYYLRAALLHQQANHTFAHLGKSGTGIKSTFGRGHHASRHLFFEANVTPLLSNNTHTLL